MLLPDEFIKTLRSHPNRQRCVNGYFNGPGGLARVK